jgi:hypothetical protein
MGEGEGEVGEGREGEGNGKFELHGWVQEGVGG